MLGIPVGIAYSHVVEWALHKHVLHGVGKKRESFWSFHFHEHHRAARTKQFHDEIYESHPFKWNGAGKEVFGLTLLAAAHLPLLPVAPAFVATLAACGLQYYRVHKRSHMDPEWAREHLPWHYDHHMGPNQDANYGVRTEWVDKLMNTREVYAGTPKELRDRARRAERAAKAAYKENSKRAA
jgi:sterol desaturase/sphingolipid hydroxylase (fatty acid hydroxylase superfamily)